MDDPGGALDEAVNAFWNEAKRRIHLEEVSVYVGPSPIAAVPPPTWSFGATPEQADALLDLVLAGTKTATAGALSDYEAEDAPLPEPGGMGIVLDGSGNPRALVVTTSVEVVPFDQVDAEHARLEGEGDRSLEHWREVHERFFETYAPGGFSPDMDVVLERFKVAYPKPSRRTRRPDVTTVEIVGGVEKRELKLAPYDPAWPAMYADHEQRIRAALGPAARQVEHIGSTSVPGLAAKPIIDVLVTVEDIAAEEDYLDRLIEAGYELRVREPGHRMVRTPERDVHVHVLEVGAPAAEDYLVFRDHLRADDADRDLYERTKRDLLEQDWPDMNAYADAKTDVISEIKERARNR